MEGPTRRYCQLGWSGGTGAAREKRLTRYCEVELGGTQGGVTAVTQPGARVRETENSAACESFLSPVLSNSKFTSRRFVCSFVCFKGGT